MVPFLEILSFGFSLWMFVDALRRKADFYWYVLIILLGGPIPIGGFIYFFVIKLPELQAASADGSGIAAIPFPIRKGPSIRSLQAQVNETPSQQNKLVLAWALFDDNRIDESSQIFVSCHQDDDDDAECVYGIARCLSAHSQHQDAARYYEKVIKLDRVFRDYDPWLDLALGYLQADDQNKAYEILRKLVEEAPRVKHKTVLGRCLADAGLVGEARTVLAEAIADYEESSFFLQRDNENWVNQARELLAGLPTNLH